MMYQQWIAQENASGALYQVTAETADEVYRLMGKQFGMVGWDKPGFDTGNVDVNLYKVRDTYQTNVNKITFEEEPDK